MPLSLSIKKQAITEWATTSQQMSSVKMFRELYPKINDFFLKWKEDNNFDFDQHCRDLVLEYYYRNASSHVKFTMTSSTDYNNGFLKGGSQWAVSQMSYFFNNDYYRTVNTASFSLSMFLDFQRVYDVFHEQGKDYIVGLTALICHEYAHILQYVQVINDILKLGRPITQHEFNEYLDSTTRKHTKNRADQWVEYYGEQGEIHGYAAQAAAEIIHHTKDKATALKMIANRDPQLKKWSESWTTYLRILEEYGFREVFDHFVEELIAQINQA